MSTTTAPATVTDPWFAEIEWDDLLRVSPATAAGLRALPTREQQGVAALKIDAAEMLPGMAERGTAGHGEVWLVESPDFPPTCEGSAWVTIRVCDGDGCYEVGGGLDRRWLLRAARRAGLI